MKVFDVTVTGIDADVTNGWDSTARHTVQVSAERIEDVRDGDEYTEVIAEFVGEDIGGTVLAFDIENVTLAEGVSA